MSPLKDAPDSAADDAPVAGRSRARRLRRIALEVALVGLAYAAVTGYQGRGHLPRASLAPDFDVELLDGTRVSRTSLQGKNTIVHFWATWCGVCQREFGMLNRLAQELPEDTVLLTLVSAEPGEREEIQRFAVENQLQYTVGLAPQSLIRDFNVRAYPTNYFLDPAGKIRSSTVGMSTGWAMRARAGCDGPF